MPYVIAAVVIVGLVTSLNLLLTYGVIRRLREHTRILAERTGNGPDAVMLGAGAEPADFTARATGGQQVSRESLSGTVALVGFFTASCAPCKEQAPLFIQRAATLGADRVLAVVVGADTPEERELVARFEAVATVVVEPPDGAVQRAFAVHGYPALCLLDGHGRIMAAGSAVDRLPELPALPVA